MKPAALPLILMSLLPGLARANFERLDEKARDWCAKADPTWVKVTSRNDQLVPPDPDHAKYPFELPLVITVYNHRSAGDWINGTRLDEKELRAHVERARLAWGKCGITVSAQVRFVEGPEFLNDLDRAWDYGDRIGERTRCLLKVVHQKDKLNVIYVNDINASVLASERWNLSKSDPGAGAYTMAGLTFRRGREHGAEADFSYIGTVFVTDKIWEGAFEHNKAPAYPYFLPHEIGHAILNDTHVRAPDGREDLQAQNLMNVQPWRNPAMTLTKEQCEKAKTGNRFVQFRPRAPQPLVAPKGPSNGAPFRRPSMPAPVATPTYPPVPSPGAGRAS